MMTSPELTRTLIDGTAIASLLLDAALKGTVVLILALGLSVALRRASASLRHMVWSLALASVLVLPLLRPLLPQWRVPGLAGFAPAVTPTERSNSADVGREPGETEGQIPALPSRQREVPPQPAVSFVVGTPGEHEWVSGRSSEMSGEPAEPYTVRSGYSWTALLVLVWLAGALLVSAGIVAGLRRTWHLARRARELTENRLAGRLAELAAGLRLTRRIRLLGCPGPCMPMTWGLVRPKILLPGDAGSWSNARLRVVLLHELAHVKRFDYLTQLLARFTCALHWFNPLVWLAARRLRVERELACDDLVLRAGSRASEYADHLLDMACSLRPFPTLVGVAMARPSQLSRRLRAVLDPRRRRTALTPSVAIPVWLLFACVISLVAAAAPRQGVSGAPDLDDSAVRVASGEPAEVAGAKDIVESTVRVASVSEISARLPGSADVGGLGLPVATRPQAGHCDWLARGRSLSTWIQADDRELRVKLRQEDCELEIELDGELSFSEDETDVLSISRGGELEIVEKAGRETRRLTMEPRRDGTVERHWYVNREERPFDADARAWLGDMILVLFRRVGYQARERAERILATRGVDGLLQEISQISADHTARRYYSVLLSKGDLGPERVRQVVRQAGEEIESDYELAQLLIAVAESQPLDESVRVAYVEAAESIDSDYEHRRVLSAILKREGLSAELQRSMLESSTMIGSDYELTSLLIELIQTRPLDETMTDEYFAAVATIDSDYEMRRVLDAALAKGAPNREFLDLVLEAAQGIDSDYELARLLIGVAGLYPLDQEIPPSYLAAAALIDSGYELRRVLKALVDRGELRPTAQVGVLEAARSIGSDHEISSFLQAFVTTYGLTDAARVHFFHAVGTIGSDFEHRRVLAAVLEAEPVTEANVEAVLESALEIDSDHEMASLLVQVARKVTISDRLRPAFMRAADTIGSEHERGRALSAAFPREH